MRIVPHFLLPIQLVAGSLTAQTQYKFDFGPGPAKAGYTAVGSTATYNTQRGYGFDFNVPVTCADRGGNDSLTRDVCYGSKPFYFSMLLAEGNYTVSVTLGDATLATSTTVKSESRRLCLEKIETVAGSFATRTFTVNRRNVAIAGTGSSVGITSREMGGLNWDGNKLTIEFNGSHPSVAGMEVAPAESPRQVFLAGNSTQCDWSTESETAWGQMFPRFFTQGAVVVSLAEAGLTGTAFINQKRLDKITSLMKPGDYLLAEFAHNDMGSLDLNAFKANFVTFITRARARNGIPVLVTPTPRRTFSGATATNSFVNGNGDYLAAVKQVAKDNNAVLIDLNACGTRFIEALGPAKSAQAYWYNPESGQDNTHWNRYGAYEIAKCVAQGVKDSLAPLAALLAPDFAGFDPDNPDPVDTLRIPASADTSVWHRTVGLHVMPPGSRDIAENVPFSVDASARRIAYRFSDQGRLADGRAADGRVEFSIHAMNGMRMATRQIILSQGRGTFAWDEMAVLPKGLYFMQMKVAGRVLGILRFLKS